MSLKGESALDELRISLDNLKIGEKIGEGGFSVVYEGQLLINNKPTTVAIKELNGDVGKDQFVNEIFLLSRYRDENVVSLKGFVEEEGRKILVFEHLFNGSLDKYLDDTSKYKDFTWVRRLKICIGAAKGLLYLHNVGNRQRVIHRDIKSANILIDENWEPKLADFGLSRMGPANQPSSIVVANAAGTPGYVPPDYVNTNLLTKEVDVFAFGVVMFELLCGRVALLNQYTDERRWLVRLAKESSEPQKLEMIIDQSICNDIASASLKVFSETAYRCLEGDRRKRPTMAVVVENLEEALHCQRAHDKEKKNKTENENGIASPSMEAPEDEDDTYWVKKLPRGYQEIFRREYSRKIYATTTKRNLYDRLCEGVLVDNGTKFFWVSKLNGKVYQRVSASDIFMDAKWNLKSHSLISTPLQKMIFQDATFKLEERRLKDLGPGGSMLHRKLLDSDPTIPPNSRFSHVAKFDESERINMHCTINSELLSPDTTYTAYLLFRYGSIPVPNMVAVECNFKIVDRRYRDKRVALKGEDHWVEIEMWQFVSNGENVVFDFELKKLRRLTGLNDHQSLDIYIEGIEFRPLDYDHGVEHANKIQPTEEEMNEVTQKVSETELEQKLLSDYQDIIRRTDNLKSSTGKELYFLLRSGIFIDNGKKWFYLDQTNGKKCCMLSARSLVIQEDGLEPEEMEWESIPGSMFPEVANTGPVSRDFEVRGRMKTRMLSLHTEYAVYLVFKHDNSGVRGQQPAEASIKFDGQEKQTRRVFLEARSDMLTLRNDQVDGISLPVNNIWMELRIWPCFRVTEDIDEIEVGIHSDFDTSYMIDGIEFRPINGANGGNLSTSGAQ